MTATVRPYDAKSKRRTCAHFTATFLLLALLTVTSTVASASASADASTQRRHLRHSHHVSRHMARSAPGNTLASGARIIGGRTVENPLERFPYFVALRDDQDLHFCGGTLIAPDIVLTAAHCL
jgi:V8-like Glu-specific endopeptidase